MADDVTARRVKRIAKARQRAATLRAVVGSIIGTTAAALVTAASGPVEWGPALAVGLAVALGFMYGWAEGLWDGYRGAEREHERLAPYGDSDSRNSTLRAARRRARG